MTKRGSVNNGRSGADKTEASETMRRTRGNRNTDTPINAAVDPRRCFLSVQEVINTVTQK